MIHGTIFRNCARESWPRQPIGSWPGRRCGRNSMCIWPTEESRSRFPMIGVGDSAICDIMIFMAKALAETDSRISIRSGSTVTREQVMDIYSLKGRKRGCRTAASLSQSYGITTKAVRDIWRGRTWSDVTSELSFSLKKDAVWNGSQISKKRKKNEVDVMNHDEKVKSMPDSKPRKRRSIY
jgi:hypothetical protein